MKWIKKTYLPLLFVITFFLGFYIWKISKMERTVIEQKNLEQFTGAMSAGSTLVTIEDIDITVDDLNFEHDLLTNALVDNDELVSIPDRGNDLEQRITALKEKILDSLVERKVLYRFLLQDKRFDVDNPSRYVSCLDQWMKLIESGRTLLEHQRNQQRLKERLCELALLHQYLDERVYVDVDVESQEVAEYFKNHAGSFRHSPRAEIRQVVLPDERSARRLRGRLKRSNFSRMARKHSITPEAASGGKLGPFAKGEMPPFFDIVFSMKPSQISDVLKSTYGFHFVTLDKIHPARDLSLQEASNQITNIIRKRKKERRYQQWVELALHSVQVTTPSGQW